MADKLLIIMVKNPIIGQVKTRLAADAGEDRALAIYQKLLLLTRKLAQNTSVDKAIFYDQFINNADLWDNVGSKHIQKGNDLGERMHAAFTWAFAQGYSQAGIIGSDCVELSSKILSTGFSILDTHDAVLGPARDGGYYFLGLKKMEPRIFTNKTWSSADVANQTRANFSALNWSVAELPELSDIDTLADWENVKLS